MSGSRYPPRGGDNRRDYDSYNGRRENNRDGRDRHNDRRASPPRGPGGAGGGDTYRPQQSSSYSHRDNYYNSQDSRRNPSGFDSWAPGTDGYRPPPPTYAQPPPPPPRDAPRPPQGEFSFRVEKPAGVHESFDSYRPSNGSVPQFGQNNGSSQLPARPPYQSNYRGREVNRRGRGGRGGRGGFVRFKAAERELLNPVHSNGPEQIFFDADAGATYRPVEELSDSDEAEMEISEGEGGGDSQEPSHKRARFGAQKSALEDSVPKWSNPDPYTALPPPDAAGKQRKDVVQLIRKARVETKESKASIPAEAADFIPCDFDDSDDDDDIEIIGDRAVSAEIEVIGERRITRDDAPGVAGAPTGPRSVQASSQDAQQGSTTVHASVPEPEKTAASQLANGNSLPPKPPVQNVVVDIKPAVSLSQPITSTTNDSSNALGSRKRTYDDEIKLPAHATLKRVNMKPGRGKIVSEWRVVGGENPCPWIVADHSGSSANPGILLHKEIVDFYEHIRPQDFEERIRGELVQQLKTLCRDIYGDAEVYPFGSFPSGLYLPTGDMDLVLCSDSVMEDGLPKYTARNVLYRLRESLVNAKVASYNDVEVIGKARVPLVKFIDTRTGLKVDVSFENLTGLNAIKTFLHWRDQYPEMPVLVTLIKHFLAMRGLNEPVNGGIGGFSVICLVVSMLQHMPDIQSRSKNGRHHYGDLLMDFFDLYGNKFHYETTAISLNPAAYIPKNRVVGFTYKNTDRLSIIDPNNSANDISGGSSNIGVITQLFSDAYRDLRQRMADVAKAGKRGNKKSILEVIFAGNYSTFRLQREHLAKLAERGLGPQPVVPPKQFGRRRNNW
ncbi:hypothetical protein GE09DRAFT_1105699 [Coniochaeta sp. 2T2.1]|nr:hypothetical protein GE09DRAFT_1105699 [Coniochaeta sp. 2T2.1]